MHRSYEAVLGKRIQLTVVEASQGEAEEVLSGSRARSCLVMRCVALQWEVSASGQGTVLEASCEVQ